MELIRMTFIREEWNDLAIATVTDLTTELVSSFITNRLMHLDVKSVTLTMNDKDDQILLTNNR